MSASDSHLVIEIKMKWSITEIACGGLPLDLSANESLSWSSH